MENHIINAGKSANQQIITSPNYCLSLYVGFTMDIIRFAWYQVSLTVIPLYNIAPMLADLF